MHSQPSTPADSQMQIEKYCFWSTVCWICDMEPMDSKGCLYLNFPNFLQALSNPLQACVLFPQSSNKIVCAVQLPRLLESTLRIPATYPTPVGQCHHLAPRVNNPDDFGQRQVEVRSWSFPWDWQGHYWQRIWGQPSGKVIKGGSRMELSCNHRALQRIVGDFLSQWGADSFLTSGTFIQTESPSSPEYTKQRKRPAWCKRAQPEPGVFSPSQKPYKPPLCPGHIRNAIDPSQHTLL